MTRSPVLVGRAGELAVVRRRIADTVAGVGGVLLVVGEAGIGKSRLLDETDRLARSSGLAVLSGRAVQGGGTYRAVTEALLRHWDGVQRRDPHGTLRPYLPALRRLLPTIEGPDGGLDASGLTPGGPVFGEVDSIVLLGEGLRRVLLAIAGDGPGCLVRLEDLHWADDDTLALVAHLAEALAQSPVLLVASARDEAGPTGPGAAARTSALSAGRGVTTVRLERNGRGRRGGPRRGLPGRPPAA